MDDQPKNSVVPQQPQTQKVPKTQLTKSQEGIPKSYSYTASRTSHCQRQGTGLEGILVWPRTAFLTLAVEDPSLIFNESSLAAPGQSHADLLTPAPSLEPLACTASSSATILQIRLKRRQQKRYCAIPHWKTRKKDCRTLYSRLPVLHS